MTILIPNLAIAGYRSFGRKPQYFERLAKINIFIGQNNAGKSNVLRFLHEIYAQASDRGPIQLDPLAHHLPDHPPMLLGIGESIDSKTPSHPVLPDSHRLVQAVADANQKRFVAAAMGKIFQAKARLDRTSVCWSLLTLPARTLGVRSLIFSASGAD